VDKTVGVDNSINLTGGTIVQGGVQTTVKWERKQSFKTTDRSTLTGSIVLDTSVREFGRNNAVRLTISENSTAGYGVVTDFRAAVLVKRKNDVDRFVSTVKMKASANFAYNAIRGLRDVVGMSPANDPVIFKPGVQYIRKSTLSSLLEEKLAEDIDENNLNATKLEDVAGVLGTTVLAVS